MPRTVRNAKIDTPSARARLKQRREPYWTIINTGCAIGYRKGSTGGTWIARYYNATRARPMTYHAIGAADDAMAADGVAALSYAQAQALAQAWCATEARVAEGLEPAPTGPYTVANALDDYLKHFRRTGKGIRTAESFIEAHIRPSLGAVELARLTRDRIEEWKLSLSETPRKVRTARTATGPKYLEPAKSSDEKRARRATTNRVLGVLKAALNRAWETGKTTSDSAWRKVKPFKGVDAPVVRYLTTKECTRLVNACPTDFRKLVRAALLTGCRYSELTNLRASDFNPDAGTLAVRESKSGKPRHVTLTNEGQKVFAAETAGKADDALILTRSDGDGWGAGHQQRPLAAACKAAKIAPAISFHVLRHTHASLLALEGVPMPVIAHQLGHSDDRMTQRHYAHLSPNYVADTIRASFPKLGIAGKTTVRAIR
jgi:integrase